MGSANVKGKIERKEIVQTLRKLHDVDILTTHCASLVLARGLKFADVPHFRVT